MPPKTVHLNPMFLDPYNPDEPFWGFSYSPFFWVSFGGDNGKDLNELRYVQATVDGSLLMELEFHYMKPIPPKKFGNMSETYREECDTMSFAVHGPGGERITAVDLLSKPWPPIGGNRGGLYWTIQVRCPAEI